MILPFEWPISETYQWTSLIQGLVRSYDSTKNAYYNYYSNVYCKNKNTMWDIGLNFWATDWDSLRRRSILEMSIYYYKTISKSRFIPFVQERLDLGQYILLYHVDEFYLPYSVHYRHEHYIHDMYLLGYEEQSFWVLAYNRKKLSCFQVEKTNVLEAAYSSYDYIPETHFGTLEPNLFCNIEIDYDVMHDDMESFLHSHGDDRGVDIDIENVYGMETYSVLRDCMERIEISNLETCFDVRPFRFIYEHKRIMRDHIEAYGKGRGKNQTCIEEYDQIVNKGYFIYMLALKLMTLKDPAIVDEMRKGISILATCEKQMLKKVLEW